MNEKELSHLIISETPEAAIGEMRLLLRDLDTPLPEVEGPFSTAVELYRGEFPGFRACNTEYHNLFHALQTFMAMGRLLHGAACVGEAFSPQTVLLGLTAAIFHDSGYLQEEGDKEGTGAKHTLSHVSRGIALVRRLGPHFGYGTTELSVLEAMILSTDLSRDYATIPYPTPEIERAGRLLDVADLMAQTSDRTYLEKLLFLFHEFREAGIRNYASEAELLRKTLGFYDLIGQRLQPTADQADRYLRAHYQRRHHLDCNPYRDSMLRQRAYLIQILETTESEPEIHLRRDGILEKVRQLYG